MKKTILFFLMIAGYIQLFSQDHATMTIKNQSERYLTVKLMKGNDRKYEHMKTDSVMPKGAQVFYMTETGQYFTKCQAVLINKKDPSKNDTIYSKDKPFLIRADAKRGYTNIIYEFTVEENKKSSGATSITSKEYKGN